MQELLDSPRVVTTLEIKTSASLQLHATIKSNTAKAVMCVQDKMLLYTCQKMSRIIRTNGYYQPVITGTKAAQ